MPVTDWLAQGRAYLQSGHPRSWMKARECLEKHVVLQTEDAVGWFLLGGAAHRLLDLSVARKAFSESCRLNPENLQAHLALATVCFETGDTSASIRACRRAVELAPINPQPWFSLGVALERSGDADEAVRCYDRTLTLDTDHVEARKNRGALLLEQGRVDEAVANNRLLAERWPLSFDAQYNLGDSLVALGDYRAALRSLQRALRIRQDHPRALLHAGFCQAQLRQFTEAQKLLDRSAELDRSQVQMYREAIFGAAAGDEKYALPELDAQVLFVLHHFDLIERCQWSERDEFLATFSALIHDHTARRLNDRALGFRAMAMGLPPADQLEIARRIVGRIVETIKSSGHLDLPATRDVPNGSRPIRIGYLSPDFRNHPVALLIGDMFSWHDRERFRVFGYSIGPDDGSPARARVVAGCDAFVDLNDLEDEAAAALIANDRIDILVDLVGYLDRARPGILARRPAPLQVSWMAYLATSGAPWLDYVVADVVALPEDLAACFSEKQIRLPGAIYPCAYALPAAAAVPARCSVGLPADGLVLCAMHSAYKIDPAVFAIWMRLLVKHDDAILWLLDCGAQMRDELSRNAAKEGVSPDRLHFAVKVPHADHLARLQCADLALDTPQCNGGTTTIDALAAGVPVLTCCGNTLMQRVAASLVHAAGLDVLVVSDLNAYEALADSLLRSPERLVGLRQQIKVAHGEREVFMPKKWLRYFESGMQMAWNRFGQGLTPEMIVVKP